MKYSLVLLIFFIGSIFHFGIPHRKEQDVEETKKEIENPNPEVPKIIKKPNVTKNATSNYSLYTWEEVDQKPKSLLDFTWEIILLVGILVYSINFFKGKQKNVDLTLIWVRANNSFFLSQFAYVGIGDGKEKGALVEQQSYCCFNFYATGRINCPYTIVTIETKRRHDLLAMIIGNILNPEKDRLIFEIPLNIDSDLHTVCAVVRTRNIKKVLESNSDLKELTRQRDMQNLDKDFVLISDTDEIAKYTDNSPLLSLIKNYKNEFQVFHITDMKTFSKEPFTMKIELNLTEFENTKVSECVMKIVDFFAKYAQSSKAKEKAQKERLRYEKKKNKENEDERKEEEEKKKQDKKKEKMANLSQEQMKKIEEKERKKNLKKQQKRIIKVVKQ